MTARHHRRFLRAKRPRTVTTYRGGLDAERQEIMPRYHRDATPDDPWLDPRRSEAVRALLIWIAAAQSHTPSEPVEQGDWDLRGMCEDAKLDIRETEVVLLVGEGWHQRQIASWLGLSQSTVCRHLSRARHKLAGWLPLAVAVRLQAA